MSDCFFCGAFVGEENGDGGGKGRTVGTKDICEQCLGELKHWLNGTIPRSPGMRPNPIEKDDDEVEVAQETTDDSEEVEDDEMKREESSSPFSASPTE